MKILILSDRDESLGQIAKYWLKVISKDLEVYSSGINPEKEIEENTKEFLKVRGEDLSSYTPNSINEFTDKAWDYILVISESANKEIENYKIEFKNKVFYEFKEIDKESENKKEELEEISKEINHTLYFLTEIVFKEKDCNTDNCSCNHCSK